MKLMRIMLLGFVLAAPNAARAGYPGRVDRYDIVDVTAEIFLLRPIGLIGTVVGGVFFLASTPFSAFATLAPPHDTIGRAAKVFFWGPAAYTFQRPFGVYRYDALGDYGKDLEALPPAQMP